MRARDDDGGDDRPGVATAGVPAALFLVIAFFLVLDVISDVREGASAGHIAFEVAATLLSLGGFAAMWRLLQAERSRARELKVELDGTRADLVRWHAEAQELLKGLGAAIDRQFDGWGLSPAEREVGLLLLKGLSLKEAAEARQTSERTVRQQALAVYRKAGLAGRAELAAFFLEDLLLPREGGERRAREGASQSQGDD
ncbi:MAG: LuxR family transcriptional regulator [Deltaproteobacteria bacterium]|nr:LuxR family transcriptional regulator [Deltaproteobacteria bacterium]